MAIGLAGLVAVSWLYLWHDAAMMASRQDAAASLAMAFAMWFVMMAAMMLPAASPAILAYSAMARRRSGQGTLPAVWIFVAGYLVAWGAFSILAVLVQAALRQWDFLTPMLASTSQSLSGFLLLAAGIYQWSPLKQACLSKCQNPIQFFMTQWRAGVTGALQMGMRHGAYCVGCCGMLMLLLFAVGVMNLLWVAVISAFVLAEKLLPAGRWTSNVAGIALIAAGLILLVR